MGSPQKFKQSKSPGKLNDSPSKNSIELNIQDVKKNSAKKTKKKNGSKKMKMEKSLNQDVLE